MSGSSTTVKKKAKESSDLLGYPSEVRIITPCKGSESVIVLSIYKKSCCIVHTTEEIISNDMYLKQCTNSTRRKLRLQLKKSDQKPVFFAIRQHQTTIYRVIKN